MHSTTKTSNRRAFRTSWFDRAPAISTFPGIATWAQRNPGELLTARTDPGHFLIEVLIQFSKLNRVDATDEQDRRDRLGMLLDRTLDLKIIGDSFSHRANR